MPYACNLTWLVSMFQYSGTKGRPGRVKFMAQHQLKSDQPSDQSASFTDAQLWQMRWFFARLYAIALLTSILASFTIVIVTKNPLPALVPTPLLLSMRPIIGYVFPKTISHNERRILPKLINSAVTRTTRESHPSKSSDQTKA